MNKYLLILLFLSSCCPKIVPSVSETIIYKDSIREILRDTTIYVPVERLVSKNILPENDTSVLENKFAKATAFIDSGRLHHELEQKEQALPVQIKYVDKEVIKTEYRNMIEIKTIEVNKLALLIYYSFLFLFLPKTIL